MDINIAKMITVGVIWASVATVQILNGGAFFGYAALGTFFVGAWV